jgi:hypothetical protein
MHNLNRRHSAVPAVANHKKAINKQQSPILVQIVVIIITAAAAAVVIRNVQRSPFHVYPLKNYPIVVPREMIVGGGVFFFFLIPSS